MTLDRRSIAPLSLLLQAYENEDRNEITCDRKLCDRPATHIVTVHPIDHCKDDGMGPAGNKVYFNCYPCGKDLVRRVNVSVSKLLKPNASRVECGSCGKKISRLPDMCRMEPLVHVYQR